MRFGELAGDSHGVDDDRRAFVLIHGLSYDRGQWEPLVRELTALDPGRRVVALDLPGHGESPRQDSYHLDDVAVVVNEAVTAAGLNAPVMVGHSLGGALVTAYATEYPVSGVVNVDQPLLVGGFREVLRKVEPVLRSPDYLQVWDQMLAGMDISLLPDAMQDLVRTATTPRQDLLLGYWDEIITASSAEELTESWTRRLSSIASRGTPYHQVNGNELAPPYREWLTSVVPGVTITVLPGGGHFPHLAHPAEFAKILLS